MKKPKKKDVEAAWWAKNFPTVAARDAADRAVDKLDPKEPMTKYLDTWIVEYIKAGGKTDIKV